VFVDTGETFEDSQPICGQLWSNDGDRMTASNSTRDGATREFVLMTGINEALSWKHV
jgi:hypothetical protein